MTENAAETTRFALVGARVHWDDQYDNAPKVQLLANGPWASEGLVYSRAIIGSSGTVLSPEQMQVVRGPVWGKKMTEILYSEHESGLVNFIAVGKESDYPRGAGKGVYKLDTGADYYVPSGWYGSPTLLADVLEVPVVSVLLNTPDSSVKLATYCRLDVVQRILAVTHPHVGFVEGMYEHVPYLLGHQTKQVWRDTERERIAPVRQRLTEEAGLVDLMGPRNGMTWAEFNKRSAGVLESEVWKSECHIRPYSALEPREQIYDTDDPWVLVCGNCGRPIVAGERYRKTSPEVFKKHAENYHCCKVEACR